MTAPDISPATQAALLALLDTMISQPLSFSPHVVAGAAERARDMIVALDSSLTAAEKHVALANKLWELCVSDKWPWSDGDTQDDLEALGLLYPKDMTAEDSGEQCEDCFGGCETCFRAVDRIEDVKEPK